MDWGALIGGGIGGALIAGAVSLINNGRQMKRIDDQLAKIDQPRLQLDQARFELERTAEPRAREREAYVELLDVFHEMSKWLNTNIDSNADTERIKHKLMARFDRAMTKVTIDGHNNVRYFAAEAAQSFQAYVNSVLMQEPADALWDRFVEQQGAVQRIIKVHLEVKPAAPPKG